jgi:hypothetical protein
MRIAMMMCGLLCLAPNAWAQFSFVNEQGSLKGLPGVNVLVEEIEAVTGGAVTKDMIQTDVELRLRQLGIKVFPRSEPERPEAARLYVNVNIKRVGTMQLFVFNMELSAQQWVRLDRAPTVRTIATTWTRGAVSYAGAEKVGQIRPDIIDLVSQFANDFLAANQK